MLPMQGYPIPRCYITLLAPPISERAREGGFVVHCCDANTLSSSQITNSDNSLGTICRGASLRLWIWSSGAVVEKRRKLPAACLLRASRLWLLLGLISTTTALRYRVNY